MKKTILTLLAVAGLAISASATGFSIFDPTPNDTREIAHVAELVIPVDQASLVSSAALESGHVMLSGSGRLISLIGYNSGPAQFVQVFNSATVPANGTAPAICFAVQAASNFSLDLVATGFPFTTGISVSNSSTVPTKTAGASDIFFTATVKQ